MQANRYSATMQTEQIRSNIPLQSENQINLPPPNNRYPNHSDRADRDILSQIKTATDPRNQINISRETNHIPTAPWKKIDDTFSNQWKSTSIYNSVTHLKNTAIHAKDFGSRQQNNCTQLTTRIARAPHPLPQTWQSSQHTRRILQRIFWPRITA